MKRATFSYLLAISVGVAGLGSGAWAADPGQNLQNAGQSFQNAGQSMYNGASQAGQGIAQGAQNGAQDLKSHLSNAADNVKTNAKLNDLKDQVAKLVDASVNKGDLNDVSDYVDKDAQSRLKNLKADGSLKQDLKQLQQDYKSRYNHDLSFKDNSGKLFQNARCVEGKVKDPNQLQQWPVQSQQGTMTSMTSYNSGESSHKDIKKGDQIAILELRSTPQGNQNQSQNGQGQNNQGQFQNQGTSGQGQQNQSAYGGQMNSSQGQAGFGQGQQNQSGYGSQANSSQGQAGYEQGQRNRSTATISAVKQDGDWRISVPHSLDANTLQQNLKNEVQQVLNLKSQWPANPDQARQLIATHILNAYYEGGSNQNGMQDANNRNR